MTVPGKLGKLAPRLDRRTLRMSTYLPMPRLPAPPPVRDWSEKMPRELRMYRNDEVGCCTMAAAGHLHGVWASQSRGAAPSDQEVVAAYAAVSGFDPSRPETDRGIDMLTALKHWRHVGIGGRKIRAFVKVDHDDWTHLKIAANLFGGIYVGAALPRSAQNLSEHWDAPRGRLTGDHVENSWGGHAMAVVAYSRTGVCFATWGRRKWASWAWFMTYVDEAYAVLADDWVDSEDVAPNGFDLAALVQDVKDLA